MCFLHSRQRDENLCPQPHGGHGHATVRQRIVEDGAPVLRGLHPQQVQERVVVVGRGHRQADGPAKRFVLAQDTELDIHVNSPLG